MHIIMECLMIKNGLVAIVPFDSIEGGEEFEFQISEGKLFYKNSAIALPFSNDLMEHMLTEDDNIIYFYGGEDPLARRYIGHFPVTRDMLLYAKGVLWALQNNKPGEVLNSSQRDHDPVPKDENVFGLPVPPEVNTLQS